MNAVVKPMPATSIAEQLLDAFPSGSYALAGLLRLLDVVETTSVPTAAVQCRAQPSLLINPEFVARHAPSPEQLVALVMHELHHVLLGHTTLFARVTPVDNFVFDAVINGLVCRMFPQPAHTRFFTDFYPADAFPVCLLRPPPGWPDAPQPAPGISALASSQRGRIAELHAALYSPAGASYKEVFDILPQWLDGAMLAGIPLLGGHDNEDGRLEQRSPLLFDAVREIVERWPQPPDPIRGRSLADVLEQQTLAPRRPPDARSVLRRLIHTVAKRNGHGTVRRVTQADITLSTPIPALARRSLVQRALGLQPLLYPGSARWPQRQSLGGRVHVYLDVSGSIGGIKSALYGAVLDSRELVELPVHLFSSTISDISLAELRRGVCRSSHGTDISCVAEHMARQRVRHALVITDGWVGQPHGEHRATLQSARLAVALVGESATLDDLSAVTNHHAHLPTGGTP